MQAIIDDKKRNLRQRFNIQSFCDIASALFTPSDVAFQGRCHRITIRVFFFINHDQHNSNYDTYDRHPSMLRRSRSPPS